MSEKEKLIDFEEELSEQGNVSKSTNTDNVGSDLLDDELLEGDGVSSLKDIKKRLDKGLINTKLFGFITVFLLVVFGIIYGIYYFLNLSLQDKKATGYDKQYMDLVDEYILKNISDSVYNGKDVFFSTTNDSFKESSKIQKVLADKGVFFYKKKEAILGLENSIKRDISSNLSSINSTKQYLVNYRYLPKGIEKLVKDIKLTPILITINSIKIYTLDDIYIKTGKFDREILQKVRNDYLSSNNVFNGIPWSQLGRYISEDIENLREMGVKTYLKDVKFNYMYSNVSNKDLFVKNFVIKDFVENHYKVLENRYNYLKSHYNDSFTNVTETDFNFQYIRYLLAVYKYTDKQLSDVKMAKFLPINIKLLSYDPKSQQLSFNIQLNIKNNETRVNVLDIAKDIVNLLRESRLIIGSDIKLNKLNIKKNVMRTPNGKQVYSSTTIVFKTSVQKDENVEVIDTDKR